MTPEDRIRLLIGDLHMQIALLSSKLEEQEAKIKGLNGEAIDGQPDRSQSINGRPRPDIGG